MRYIFKLLLGCILGGGVSLPAQAQTISKAPKLPTPDVTSALNCPRPADAKEAKVIDFDAGKSLARLAVNLGTGRFKLVIIKTADRQDDPRPIIPVIEAARIMQGKVQFYAPKLNSDPESAPDSFVLMAEMGSGYVCWASPGSLINEYQVADGEITPSTFPTGSPAAAGTPEGANRVVSAPEQFVRTKMGRRLQRERAVSPLVLQ
jgi:hypothetical protein